MASVDTLTTYAVVIREHFCAADQNTWRCAADRYALTDARSTRMTHLPTTRVPIPPTRRQKSARLSFSVLCSPHKGLMQPDAVKAVAPRLSTHDERRLVERPKADEQRRAVAEAKESRACRSCLRGVAPLRADMAVMPACDRLHELCCVHFSMM